MAGLQAQGQNPSGAGANAADGMTGFYNQVCSRQIIFRKIFLILLPKISNIQDELRRFDGNVSRIADLHSRSLNNTDEALAQQNAAALDELLVETRSLSNQIKAQIQQLEKEPVPQGQDARIRRNQASETPSAGLFAHSPHYTTVDLPRPYEIHRGFAELSAGRAAESHAIPSACRATVQNRCVAYISLWLLRAIISDLFRAASKTRCHTRRSFCSRSR